MTGEKKKAMGGTLFLGLLAVEKSSPMILRMLMLRVSPLKRHDRCWSRSPIGGAEFGGNDLFLGLRTSLRTTGLALTIWERVSFPSLLGMWVEDNLEHLGIQAVSVLNTVC